MNTGLPDRDFLRERMENHLRLRRGGDLPDEALSTRPSLTISRQCGAGFSRLGRNLLEYLDCVDDSSPQGWALFDQSFLGRIIERNSLPRIAVPFSRERSKFPVSPVLEETLKLPPPDWTLFNHCANAMRTLCLGGNALIAGRAGNFVTSDLPNTFHVRLVAGRAHRISATAERYGIGTSEATELVDETDKSRARFVKRHTAADIDNTGSYHLVINTDDLSDSLVVRIIGDSLTEWTHRTEVGRGFSPLTPLPREDVEENAPA